MSKSLDRYVSTQAIKVLQKICDPLKVNGITGFVHDITFPKGELSILTTIDDVFKYWYHNRTPCIRTDDSGRTLEQGIYLSSILEEKYEDCAEITPLFHSLAKANQSICIVEIDQDCQHMYTFLFNEDKNQILHWLINNVSQLENFVEYYKYKAKEIILEAKKPANRITVPLIKNDVLENDNLLDFNTDTLIQKLIHKQNKTLIYLSKQQSICLVLLMQGKSAKAIASKMNLSHRTVQHYFERIRKILGCSSMKDLIISYGDQITSEKWNAIRALVE